MDGKVDIKAVAAAAGVSTTTVSHVLNGVGRVSESTRARVSDIAAQLGYMPNQLARGLRRQRSDTVGLIGDEVVTTPFAGRMIAGAHDAAKARGSLLLIMETGRDPELEEREALALRQRQVDGVLYAAMYHRTVTLPSALADVPVILLDAVSSDGRLPSVVPDEVTGGRAAAEELLSAGHRRIAFINTIDDIPAAHGRLQGFRAALRGAGLRPDRSLVLEAPSTPEGGYHAGLALLSRPDRPTGIFCFKDHVAMGCYQAAAELGLRVPDDVSVVGFDNMEVIAEALRPRLTTVALPHYEMGVWAVEQLYAWLDGPPEAADVAPHEQIAGPVIRRESVSSPRVP